MSEKLSWVTNADKDYKEMLAEQKQVQENQAPPKLNYDTTTTNVDNIDNTNEGDKNGNKA